MTCKDCRHWAIKETSGSAKIDSAMISMGFKQCLLDLSREGIGRYVSKGHSCGKWERL